MKPQSFEHMVDFGYEDCGSILEYGSPSAKAHIRGKGGDIRNSFKNPHNKSKARRYFKRLDRRKAVEEIKGELMGEFEIGDNDY